MSSITDDTRIQSLKQLAAPSSLLSEIPVDDAVAAHVTAARQGIHRILSGDDDRLVVVVGPCSIHDVDAAVEYGERLRVLAAELADQLLLVMRVYFEKPRTTVGWKGLINDPDLDDSFQINKGLRLARQLLLDLNRLGLPTAVPADLAGASIPAVSGRSRQLGSHWCEDNRESDPS